MKGIVLAGSSGSRLYPIIKGYQLGISSKTLFYEDTYC